MRGFFSLAWTDVKLYVREPIATFFTLAFPPLLVLLFGAIWGNEPSEMLGGYGTMDVSMSSYTALVLGTVGLIAVPITIADLRAKGVLHRYRATPLRPLTFIGADVLSNLIMTMLGMVALVTLGRLLYDVRFEGSVPLFLVTVAVSALSMFSLGYLIASLAPNPRTANVVGMVIFYPMMFLSGAAMPIEVLPEGVRRVSEFLPLTYVVRLLRGVWFGEPLSGLTGEIAVVLGVLVVGTVIAVSLFRWE